MDQSGQPATRESSFSTVLSTEPFIANSLAGSFFRLLMESLPVSIHVIDSRGKVLWTNEPGKGPLPPGLDVARSLPDVFSGAVDSINEHTSEVLAAIDRDPRKWAWTRTVRLSSNETGPVAAICRIDLSKWRETELRLAERVKVLRYLQETSPVAQAVVHIPQGRRIWFANSAFHHLLEYSGSELEGVPFEALVSPRDESRVVSDLDAARDRGSLRVERYFRSQSGRDLLIRIHYDPIPGDEDRFCRLMLGRPGDDPRERSAILRQVVHMAETDALTGLPNRDWFLARLERELKRPHEGVLILANVDRFREINDGYGYETGDQVLTEVGRKLRQAVRPNGVVARAGANEFAVLLRGYSEDAAAQWARNMAGEISRLVFEFRDGVRMRATISAGVVLYPAHGKTVKELLGAVDTAASEAKNNGGNQIHVFAPAEDAREYHAALWRRREEIVHALDQGLYIPYFQPIVSLPSGAIEEHEALARCCSGSGIRPPSEFLPAAEHFGLAPAIDKTILRKALEALRASVDSGTPGAVSVNLSAISLDEKTLAREILGEIERNGIDASSLILEITETAAIRDLKRARSFLEELRERGIRFALDDFGVGYSSFAHLHTLPLDFLKLDRSYVENITASRFDRAFVKGMSDMAKGFGLITIAEGVSSLEILEELQNLGVDRAQGFLLGEPGPCFSSFARHPLVRPVTP